MTAPLDRYKSDLDRLIERGGALHNAIQFECYPAEMRAEVAKTFAKAPEQGEEFISALPDFTMAYQSWYSEAQALVKQLLPNRLSDFVALYEKPRGRKQLDHGTYVIADYLQGLTRFDGSVKPASAIPQFVQQLNILRSARARFDSSLFDIKQLVRADVLDSEIEAARELLKNGFGRAAGAVSGVVLEKHLQQLCDSHNVTVTKKMGTIAILNDALKDAGAIDTHQWRFIQHLGDVRNLCDHNKEKEPTKDQVSDLIDGVEKTIKTIY